MAAIFVILGVFVVLELQRIRVEWRESGKRDAARSLGNRRPEFSEENSYQMGNRLIQAFCIFMVLCSYCSFGVTGTLVALIPIFLVAAALDTFWVRVCLRGTPVLAPRRPPTRQRSK